LSEKEEYIAQCITTDKTREECEQMWNEAHKGDEGDKDKAKDYPTLVRELEMERVKTAQLTKMLKEATDIIKAVNAERDAVTEARKYEIAVEIERDSDGRMKHGDLMKESLENLSIMKKAIDSARPKDFVSTVALLEESEAKKKPQLTVGEWDSVSKKYKGGR